MARAHGLTTWLLSLLPLFALGGVHGLAAASNAPKTLIQVDDLRPNCEETYEGIVYCSEDDGKIHIISIDLDNPYIRFDTVMADDVTNVDTTSRERIEEMVNRPPYQDLEALVAINADYFGNDHGPEGLTVKNGRRLDADANLGSHQNPNALWRSSLAISRLNRVSLGRKSAAELEDPRAYRERFYNAVGGGPLILNQGVVISNPVACLLEGFPAGACRRKIQTAAGLSEDGRWLYLAVGEGRDVEGFARLLRDYGAYTAIKLDGGGSSQLWYDGKMRHDTARPVGNAMFVFYSPVPRHDARFSSMSAFPVVEPGEHVEIDFEIENTGFLAWEPDLGYRLKNVHGWPVLRPAYQRLLQPVPAGGMLLSSLIVVAPYRPGVYATEWQLVRRAERIGTGLRFALAVVPPGHAEAGLREQLETRLAEWRNLPGFEQEWSTLRRELERQIWRHVEADLRAIIYDQKGRVREVEVTTQAWWLPLPRPLPW